MKNKKQSLLVTTVLSLSDRHRLDMAKIIIWNAEIDELEEIICEAQRYLPAEITYDLIMEKIREDCGQLSHAQLRTVRTYIDLMLEGPCKTEECQKECNQL